MKAWKWVFNERSCIERSKSRTEIINDFYQDNEEEKTQTQKQKYQ